MDKKYFGSFSLQNTIRTVKNKYPECKVEFKENEEEKHGEGKHVSFEFTSDDRKKHGLSENIRTYSFLNGHLILANGRLDPFKYDKLDNLIEKTELEFDVYKKKDSIKKIVNALGSCQKFHDSAVILVGNVSLSGSFDIKLCLNEMERVYHVSNDSNDVHMQKVDAETPFLCEKEYRLSRMPSDIKYRILKTTHPGLLSSATEYISGIRQDKADWSAASDAYIKPWKKDIYERLGISPLDVAADVAESRVVGKFADRPMRRLILMDDSEYAYGDLPLTVFPYSIYEAERDDILNSYKADIMKVCEETGIIPPKAIELMKINQDKIGTFVLCKPEEAIMKVRIERLLEPLTGVIQKINRVIKLHSHERGFLASLRRAKNYNDIRKLDINENGTITRIDADIMSLSVSAPYTIIAGHKRAEVTDLSNLPLTKSFIETLKTEVDIMGSRTEYKTYKFTKEMEAAGFAEGAIVSDDEYNIYKKFYFPDNKYFILLYPYQCEIGVNRLEEIEKDAKMSEMLDRACLIAEEILKQK